MEAIQGTERPSVLVLIGERNRMSWERLHQQATAWRRLHAHGQVHVLYGEGEAGEWDVPNGVVLHPVEPPALADGDLTAWQEVFNIRVAALGSVVLSACGPFVAVRVLDEQVQVGAAMLAELARCPLYGAEEAWTAEVREAVQVGR